MQTLTPVSTQEQQAQLLQTIGERYYHRTDAQLAQFAAWRPEFEKA